jgi:tRNA(Leu) C34 or U34 (ribose-2'-O)-methylase TrmL
MSANEILIGLVNPKSPDNVASVMRAAGNYQVNQIFHTGTRYARALTYQDNPVNLSRKVSQGVSVSATESLIACADKNMKIVCVELAIDAVPLPDYIHPDKALYIFGPEDGSIDQSIIDQADDVVYIPTVGCMNLAATVNVLLYDRLAKQQETGASNELVRNSRDRNNRLKVS